MDEFLDEPDDLISDIKLKPQFYVLVIWFSCFILEEFFVYMKWPFGSVLHLIGTAGLFSYTMSVFLRYRLEYMVFFWIFSGLTVRIIYIIWGVFYNEGIPFNKLGLLILSVAVIVIFGIQEAYFRNNKT